MLALEMHPGLFDAGARAKIRDAEGTKHLTAAHRHSAEELREAGCRAGLGEAVVSELRADASLVERFRPRHSVSP